MCELQQLRSVYTIMSYDAWQAFKLTSELGQNDELEAEGVKDEFRTWIVEQVDGILGQRPTGIRCAKYPIYCFTTRPRPPFSLRPSERMVILKIRVSDALCVEFDDNQYVDLLNSFAKGMHEYMHPIDEVWTCDDLDALYIEDKNKYSDKECIESYIRMFDVSSFRTERRVFIPMLTRNMIKKVWIYRNCKILRKKTK
jgi:hypothetical protein